MMSFAYVYFKNPLNSIFGNLFSNNNPSADFASFFKTNEKAARKAIEKLVKTFDELG